MLFSLLQLSWAINIQRNEVILKTYSIADSCPNTRRFVQVFFLSSSIGTSDRYVQQIDRAITNFYNFFNFNILSIVQFRYNSPIVLLHLLSPFKVHVWIGLIIVWLLFDSDVICYLKNFKINIINKQIK